MIKRIFEIQIELDILVEAMYLE